MKSLARFFLFYSPKMEINDYKRGGHMLNLVSRGSQWAVEQDGENRGTFPTLHDAQRWALTLMALEPGITAVTLASGIVVQH